MNTTTVDRRLARLLAHAMRACAAIALLVLASRSLIWPGFEPNPAGPSVLWLLIAVTLPLLLSPWHRAFTEVRSVTVLLVSTTLVVMGLTIVLAAHARNLTWWHLPLQGIMIGCTAAALGLSAPAAARRTLGVTRREAVWAALFLVYLAALWVVGLLNPAHPIQEAHWLGRQSAATVVAAGCAWLMAHDLRRGLGDVERRIRMARWVCVSAGVACAVVSLATPWLQTHSLHRITSVGSVVYGTAALCMAALSLHGRWRHHSPAGAVVLGLVFLFVAHLTAPGLALTFAFIPAVGLPLVAPRRLIKLVAALGLAGLGVMAFAAEVEPVHVFMNCLTAALLSVAMLWIRLRGDLLDQRSTHDRVSPVRPTDPALADNDADLGTWPTQGNHVQGAMRWALGVFVLSGAGAFWGIWLYGESLDRSRTAELQARVDRQADAIVEALVDVQFRAHALYASIGEHTPSPQHFERIASSLYRGMGPGDSLGWAPSGVVTYLYPLAGNEAAIGHDLLADPRRRDAILAMIRSREPAWDGPYPLRQGGLGLLYRIPEFDKPRGKDPHHPGSFSGITTALMRLPDTLANLIPPEATGGSTAMQVWIGSSPDRMVPVQPEPRPAATAAAESPASASASASASARAPGTRPKATATRVLKPYSSNGTPLSRAWTGETPSLPGQLHLRVEADHADATSWADLSTHLQSGLMVSTLLSWLTLLLVRRNHELVEARARQHETEDLHRLLEASMTGMILYTAAGRCEWFNEAALRISGGGIARKRHDNFWADADFLQRGWVAEARAAMEDGTTRDAYYIGTSSTGHAMRTHMRFHRLQYGGQPYLLVQGTDVTELHAKESALRATRSERDMLEERLGTLYQHAKVGLALFEGQQITWINDGARTMLGRDPQSMIGRSNRLFFASHADWVDLGKLSQATLARGELFEGEVRFQRADGTLRWMYVSMQVADPARQPWRIAGVFLDITERHEMEQRMRLAQTAAEQADRAKGRFVSNMSHEMRTPLNALLGYARLLGRTQLSPEQTTHVARLELAAQSLLGLVNDVLDLSRIEADEFRLNPEATDLGGLIDGVGQLMRGLAQERGLQLHIDPLPSALRTLVWADGARLRQVLVNLIGNAIKFTDHGHVRLGATHGATRADGGLTATFIVQDTGPGMSTDLQSRLFQRFSQGDDSATRHQGGSGLGLAIVREIVQAMQGSVNVLSHPGKGSTFTVELPLEPCHTPRHDGTVARADSTDVPPERPAAPAVGQRLTGLRLLVVDDSEVNRDVASSLLACEGAHVDTAADGRQAVDWLREPGHVVDAVLMDLQMPVMDGYAAVSLLRRDPRFEHLPFIALSADVSPEARSAASQAGLSAFVGKPFDLESLASVLLQQVAQVRPQAVPRSAPPVAAAATDPQPTQVPPPVWPALPGIDLAMAQRQSRQDLGRFRRYLDQFLQQFIALREASPPLDNNDERERLIAQCHKLAGSAGIVGAQALADLARSAEQAGRSGDWPRMTADLERIGRALSDLAESGRTLDEHTTDA